MLAQNSDDAQIIVQYQNAPPERTCQSFRNVRECQFYPSQSVVTNLADPKLGPNTISTTKTNKITFLPYNMLFQLTRASNFYFLLIAAMQLVPSITLTFGAPTVLLPLTIVIVCSLLRELFEEIKRHRHDHKENETVVNVLREGKWQTAAAMTLRVGELIRLEANDKVMADVLLLKASELQVYVETMNLDGETTKKGKRAPADLYDLCAGPLGELRLRVDYQPPNPFLYRFEGTLQLPSKSVPLTSENVLLRGSNLRVTKWAEGMVLYSGFNTKVMLNGATPRQKRSRLDRQLQLVMIGLLVVMMATTFSYALASSLIATTTKQAYKATTDGLLQQLFSYWGLWILIISNFIPISLPITLELINLIHASLIEQAKHNKALANGRYPEVESSSMNPELGQVTHILSDKTGTLTRNIMNFRQISILGHLFGTRFDEGLPSVPHVEFADKRLLNILSAQQDTELKGAAELALTIMASCHSILIEHKEDFLVYNATSPDELALVNFCKFCGVEFQGIDERNCVVLHDARDGGTRRKLQLLHDFQFNSQRKRKTIVARSGDTIFLFCKGADIALEPLLLKTPQNLGVWAKLSDHLHQFSLEGLRTLALGYRTVTENEYLEWAIRYAQALEGERDEELVDLLERELEEGLLALAVTAVEDRLQESVGETITAFRDRGIKFWMLTGDRRETAINVGYACGLLEQSTRLTILNRQDLIELQIESARKAFGPSHGLLLTGELLSELGENDLTLVLTFALECAAVIACRVSPSQKELLAGRVGRACTTLAVGDGANDVAMITRASVGVGIRGLEGGQAASSADYAIGEFRVLGELVLVWGPEVYRKNSYLIFYSLYKNMLLSLPLLFYAFLSNFSGFSYYNGWIFQFYNILFTSVPVLLLCSTDELSSRRHKLSHPEAYAAGPNDAYFNCWQGLRWAARVAAESAVLLFFIFYIEEGALCSEKRMFYATATGMTIFGCIVALTNLKILAAAHGLSLALLFSSFVSILCFYLVYLLLNFFQGTDIFLSIKPEMASFQFWIGQLSVLSFVYAMDCIVDNLIGLASRFWENKKSDQENDSLEEALLEMSAPVALN